MNIGRCHGEQGRKQQKPVPKTHCSPTAADVCGGVQLGALDQIRNGAQKNGVVTLSSWLATRQGCNVATLEAELCGAPKNKRGHLTHNVLYYIIRRGHIGRLPGSGHLRRTSVMTEGVLGRQFGTRLARCFPGPGSGSLVRLVRWFSMLLARAFTYLFFCQKRHLLLGTSCQLAREQHPLASA